MKLIVTGGTGFIGSHFLRAAIAANHEVIAIRRPGSRPRIPIEGSIHWVDAELSEVNFQDLGDLSEACLVHLAAYGVSPQPCEWDLAFRYNVEYSVKIFSNAIQAGIKNAVVCGSCVEYGTSASLYDFIPTNAPLEPIGAYAASKAAQTIALSGLARECCISLTILRPFTVYGEGQHSSNFWPSLQSAALMGHNFPMTEGLQIRDFEHVSRVADSFLNAALQVNLSPGIPIIKNLGTGYPQTLRAFAEEEWKKADGNGKVLFGAIETRANEIYRYVPKIEPSQNQLK